MTGQVVTFGGRAFRVVEHTTIRQDAYVQQLLVQADLFPPRTRAGESADEFAARIVAEAVTSGAAVSLVAAMLEPLDRPGWRWNPEAQRETEAHLEDLSDPADKAEFYAGLTSVVAGFFLAGLLSNGTSPTSSSLQPQADQPEPTAAH